MSASEPTKCAKCGKPKSHRIHLRMYPAYGEDHHAFVAPFQPESAPVTITGALMQVEHEDLKAEWKRVREQISPRLRYSIEQSFEICGRYAEKMMLDVFGVATPSPEPVAQPSKLLPCPFCGSEAEVGREGDRRQSCIVACTNCGCRLESNENGSGHDWNMREPVASGVEPTPEAAEPRCIDCGFPKGDSRYHHEAPGTNWGAALHHFKPPALSLEPAAEDMVQRILAEQHNLCRDAALAAHRLSCGPVSECDESETCYQAVKKAAALIHSIVCEPLLAETEKEDDRQFALYEKTKAERDALAKLAAAERRVEEQREIISACHLALGEDPASDDETMAEGIQLHREAGRELSSRAERLETELEQAKKASEWISVEERLPEQDEEVLVTGYGFNAVALLAGDSWFYFDFMRDDTDYLSAEVTHWQPLPAPPLAQRDKEDSE